MISVFAWILMLIALASALLAVSQKDLLMAVISSSVVSLVVSIYFFLLKAPDVAMTEAAIGVGLVTIIFVIAIRKTRRTED
jgi:multicomponent Na+:H+ antiporter subunit A